MLPYENDLISKLRETLMDTLEHNTVGGHPNISVMHDNNLTTLSDLAKTWHKGRRHISTYDSIAPFWCQSVHYSHGTDDSKQIELFFAIWRHVPLYVQRSKDASRMFILRLYDEERNIFAMADVE